MMFNRAAPLPAEENETGKTKKMIQTPRRALGDKKNSVLTEEKIAPHAYSSTRKGLRPSRLGPVTPGKKNQILVFEDDVKAEESVIPTKNVDKVEEEKEDVNEESWMEREEIETFGRAPFARDRDATILASNTILIEPPSVMDNDTCEDEVEEEKDWELAIERATCDHDHGHVYDDVVACYPFEIENVILTENSNDDDENDTAYASIESDTEGEQGVSDAKEEYTHERFLQEYHDFFKRLGHEPQGFQGLHL